MFRITTHIEDGQIVLKLEGCLAGASVEELGACWRAASGIAGPQPICVDLREVCHVDAAGRELMMSMYRARVRLVTRGCVMPELVREIAETVDGGRN
jgi:anti-anti-sigma regulatory factor